MGYSPAWAVDANQLPKGALNKRETLDSARRNLIQKSLVGDAKIRWIDQVDEYYLCFLRTRERTKTRCWYSHHQSTPRSVTVKLLRKRSEQCVPVNQLHKIGVVGLPGELSKLWVWEEHAVIFCCDCAPRNET